MVRLLTTHGGDSGFATGQQHVDSMFEHLATVEMSNRGTFQASLSQLQASGDGGAVVAVFGRPHDADVERVGHLTGRAGALAVVRFGRMEGPSASLGGGSQKMRLVVVPDGGSFRDAWDLAIAPAASGVSS